MRYEPILKLAIIPTILFFLLSLLSVILTVYYWILGDWVVPRAITVTTQDFDSRTNKYVTDDTVVYFTDKDTDTTIASGVLCLAAAVFSLVAWTSLRRPNMDTQVAAGKRRFMVLSVVVMTAVGAVTALASFILHYTQKGNNEFDCTSERLLMAGKMNSNQYCTRETAACNFQPRYLTGTKKTLVGTTCNSIVVVKYLQLILIVNAAVVFVMFAMQARIRRTTKKRSYSL